MFSLELPVRSLSLGALSENKPTNGASASKKPLDSSTSGRGSFGAQRVLWISGGQGIPEGPSEREPGRLQGRACSSPWGTAASLCGCGMM